LLLLLLFLFFRPLFIIIIINYGKTPGDSKMPFIMIITVIKMKWYIINFYYLLLCGYTYVLLKTSVRWSC